MASRAEVRGRGKTWKVWVPDPAGATTHHLIYDVDGNVKGAIQAAGPSGKMIELHSVFKTAEEAVEYARVLGFTEIITTRTKTKVESLAAARKAKGKKEGAA